MFLSPRWCQHERIFSPPVTDLKSGLIDPNPSFSDETNCVWCCINRPSPWLNELLLIFGADPALPLKMFSPCMKRFWCDDGLKLFDGILTGFVLWSSPEEEKKEIEFDSLLRDCELIAYRESLSTVNWECLLELIEGAVYSMISQQLESFPCRIALQRIINLQSLQRLIKIYVTHASHTDRAVFFVLFLWDSTMNHSR